MTVKPPTANRQPPTGFTLVEAMVAVAIITLAVAGPLYTANRAMVAARIARDQLTASYLAQEGVEYARRMRDNEFLAAYQAGGANLSSAAWNAFLSNPSSDASAITECRAPKACTLDPVEGSAVPLTSCPSGICSAPLYLLPNGVYSQQNVAGSRATPFVRSIQTASHSQNEESVVSKVSWDFHGIPYSVTVIGHLTPWQ